jgi:hypothetical protein
MAASKKVRMGDGVRVECLHVRGVMSVGFMADRVESTRLQAPLVDRVESIAKASWGVNSS